MAATVQEKDGTCNEDCSCKIWTWNMRGKMESEKQEVKSKVSIPAQKNVKVLVVKRIGSDAQIVQWKDGDAPLRSLVPVQDTYTIEDLRAGIPKSVDWGSKIKLQADPKVLAQNLFKRDIWNTEDAKRNPNSVISALMETYGADLTAIISIAENKE